eukprot:3188959-Prymnesium_polylepis.1
MGAAVAAAAEREAALEGMLRELTNTMRLEIGRCDQLQQTHEREVRRRPERVPRAPPPIR